MSRKRILVVEDHPINVKLVRLLLQQRYEVRTAGDADEALDALREFHPDLILMDIQLPGMDGLELTRRLKADRQTRHIVVVALTAYAMKGDEDKALAAGCSGYITKPIDTKNFLQQIGAYLGEQPSELEEAR
jgi:two-component system cell cycle response regulator